MTNNLITRIIRYMLLIGILLSAFSAMKASTLPASVDSLQTLLKNDTDARQRAIIYIHLADIYVDSINIAPVYWDKALTEAAKAKDEYMMKLALDMLIQPGKTFRKNITPCSGIIYIVIISGQKCGRTILWRQSNRN